MEKLGLLELLDRDGSVRQQFALTHWPVRIGRDLQCDVVLDDPHVAAVHAQISRLHAEEGDAPGAPERLQLSVGASLNGVQMQVRRLQEGQALLLSSGDEWQMGRSRLRLRLASAPLSPEQPLLAPTVARPAQVVALLLAALLWVALESYVGSDPDGFWSSYVRDGLTVVTGLAVWSFLWAIVTKLFQHRMEFWRHVTLATAAALFISVLGAVLAFLAYSLSWEWLGRMEGLASLVVLAGLIYGHLLVVQPLKRQAMRWFAGSMCVLMVAGNVGLNWYRFERFSPELYLSALFPPALRLAPQASVDEFLQSAASLQAGLERSAKEPVSGINSATAAEEDN